MKRLLIIALQACATFFSPHAYASDFDVLNFCQKNVAHGRKAIRSDAVPYISTITPWDWLQYPAETSRRAIFDGVLARGYEDDKTIDEMNFFSAKESVMPILYRGDITTNIQFADEYKTGQKFGWALCGFYSPLNALQCSKALTRNLQLTAPHNGNALPSVYLEVLGDKKTLQGIYLVAERVKRVVISDLVPENRLFEDLEAAYKQLGDNQKNAEKRAWSVMAMFSTGGANTAIRIETGFGPKSKNSSRIAAAVLVVTVGAEVLDARTVTHGYLYSLPRNVPTDCDSGKPYHFWMPAYLARKAVLEGTSEESSRLAAWLVEIGYQMVGSVDSRNPELPFTTSWDDPGNNKIRIDLAYAAAGAIYGAASLSRGPALKLDAALVEMHKKAEHLPPHALTPSSSQSKRELLSRFLRWNRLFKPKHGYDAILDALSK